MTRKDFEIIARALSDAQPPPSEPVERAAWYRTVRSVSGALRSTNPRFDRDRFERACGAILPS